MKTAIAHYKSVLKSWGFDCDEDGFVNYPDGSPAQFTYNKVKRRLVVPTAEIITKMTNGELEDPHAFHPMCESALDGESGTVRFIKLAIKNAVWTNSMNLIEQIITLQAAGAKIRDNGYKKFLNRVCADIKDPQFDSKLLASWEKFVGSLDAEWIRKKGFTIYIGQDLRIDDVKYLRVLSSASAFEEIDGDDAILLGVKLGRKQDKAIIASLLKTVFGWFPAEVGSNDGRPYYGCLLRAWAKYVESYNDVVRRMKDATLLKPIESDWCADVESLRKFDDLIQTLPYNTGPVTKQGEKREFHLSDSVSHRSKPVPTASELQKAAELILAAKAAEEEPTGPLDALSFLSRVADDKKKREEVIDGVTLGALSPAEREIFERQGGLINRGSVINRMSLSQALGIEAQTEKPKSSMTTAELLRIYEGQHSGAGYSVDILGNAIANNSGQQPQQQNQIGGGGVTAAAAAVFGNKQTTLGF